jgi:Zn-finger nucleic acid-binding protein
MRCPIDGSELHISDRQGIEIDFCPKCRGVWLDRGELDKILERSAPFIAPREERGTTQPRRPDYDDDVNRQPSGGHPKKRRKNMLEELFDFG